MRALLQDLHRGWSARLHPCRRCSRSPGASVLQRGYSKLCHQPAKGPVHWLVAGQGYSPLHMGWSDVREWDCHWPATAAERLMAQR